MSNASTPVKIHGLHQSTCTQRVKVIAYEKGVDVQVDPVNFAAAEHKSPAHLEYQPFGQIPYLDDDGFVLFESRAIGRYIAAKYANQGTKLLPSASDLKAVAIFEQGASIELAGFEPCAGGIYLQKIVIPFKGGKTDEAKLKEHHDTLKTKLQGYERMLGKHKYLAGDEISVVDLYHLPHAAKVEVAFPGFFDDSNLPNVTRWYKDITSRPSWKRVLLEATSQ